MKSGIKCKYETVVVPEESMLSRLNKKTRANHEEEN